jgi:hypothetical protein
MSATSTTVIEAALNRLLVEWGDLSQLDLRDGLGKALANDIELLQEAHVAAARNQPLPEKALERAQAILAA